MIRTVADVESYCNLMNKSKLIKPKEIQNVYQDWRKRQAKGAPGETDRFIDWLRQYHYLTDYQAQQLALGRADHFFLNHYRLLDLIGKGKMAGIFKAAHSTLGHIVAIKVIPPVKSKDPVALGRFRREAKMAVKLQHPNIVRTHHLGQVGARYYIVMEYLEGESLEDVLKRRKKLPLAEGLRLVHQALMGLQHIHEQKLVHRDLKPGNLMLVPPPPPGAADTTLHANVKILDIGVGRFMDEADAGSEEFRLTTDGTMLGESTYMAPEQAINAHNVDIRADLYSMGCILYQVLTGQPPFVTDNPVMQIMMHATEKPRPLHEVDRSIPVELSTVVDLILAKDPNQRYATPGHAARSLERFLPFPPHPDIEVSSATQSYLKWVEQQGLEESAAPTSEKWFFQRGGQKMGPFTSQQLSEQAVSGFLKPTDRIWMDGDDPALAILAKQAIIFPAVALNRPSQMGLGVGPTPVAYTPGAPGAPPVAIPVAMPPGQVPMAIPVALPPGARPVLPAQRLSQLPPPAQPVQAAPALAPVKEIALPQHFLQAGAAPSTRQPGQESMSLHEIYTKAQATISSWVDLDRNRRLLLIGDMQEISEEAEIVRFMQAHKPYGEEFLHRIWKHLQFMVENRRKYYSVFA